MLQNAHLSRLEQEVGDRVRDALVVGDQRHERHWRGAGCSGRAELGEVIVVLGALRLDVVDVVRAIEAVRALEVVGKALARSA